MSHTFTFTIDVEVEREEGLFASRHDIAEAIIDETEQAIDGASLYNLGSSADSIYTLTSFSMQEVPR